VDAQISSSTGKTLNVTFPVRVLPASEKQKSAIKLLVICWLASIGTVFLPLVHFVAVPGFFIAGIVMFYRRLNQPVHTEPFEFNCPECGGKIPVAERVFEPEWEQVCPSCHFALKIEAKGPSPA
jgi:predicted RNA-binding Zn-ribbon protein involved in translation (DUF1610 family)